jgi:hypothetical protein
MMDITDYVIELPFLKYDKQALIDYMKGKGPWVSEGYANKYLRPKDSIDLFSDIYKQIPEFEIDIGRVFFAELEPFQFLHPHKDLYRKASINIPLIGDFTKTPVTFYSEKSTKKEHILYKHCYNDTATVINTEVYHGVVNTTNEKRYIFCLSVYPDWDTIKQVYEKYNGV